jgi:hypothetical protein
MTDKKMVDGMELVMREWLLRRLYPDPRHKSEALVEGKPAPPFSRNTSSPKMTGKKNIPLPPRRCFRGEKVVFV